MEPVISKFWVNVSWTMAAKLLLLADFPSSSPGWHDRPFFVLCLSFCSSSLPVETPTSPPPHTHTSSDWQRVIKVAAHLLGKLTSITASLPPSCISVLSIGPTRTLVHHPLFSLTRSFTVSAIFITHLPLLLSPCIPPFSPSTLWDHLHLSSSRWCFSDANLLLLCSFKALEILSS